MSSVLEVNNITPDSILTVNGNLEATGELRIDGKSIEDTGTIADPISGASKIGVYNDFTHSGSSTVQEVLKDFDGAIDDSQQKIISGTGTPAIVPTEVGQLYVDTVGQSLYVATGTSSVQNWIVPDNGLKMGYLFPGGFGSVSLTANYVYVTQVTSPFTTIIRRIGIYLTSCAADIKFIMGIYSDNNGSPGTLLGQTVEIVTVPVAYDVVFLDLLDPVAVTKDNRYWLAYHGDIALNIEKLKGVSVCGKRMNYTYSGSLPASYVSAANDIEMSISAW